jgi:hypothetical protein
MVQWKQIAQREGWKDVVRLPEVKFSETILDPVHALALLLFAGKSLWLKPSHGELIRLTYEKPYFIITVWKEGSAQLLHLSLVKMPLSCSNPPCPAPPRTDGAGLFALWRVIAE